jgi:GST-like protein
MIDLYSMGSPNVLKVAIMLEEVKLPWREHYVNVFRGEQYASDFLAMGPNNKVPVIVDSDGPNGTTLSVFESGAILIYLADKTAKLLARDPAERSVQLQWLMMQMSTVGPMLGQYAHFLLYAAIGHDYSRARYRTEMRRILNVLECRLGAVAYLGGTDYSIADIATFPWIRTVVTMFPPFRGKVLAQALVEYPALLRWFLAVIGRPAVVQGIRRLEFVAKDKPSLREASPDDIDRFLGRGKYAKP